MIAFTLAEHRFAKTPKPARVLCSLFMLILFLAAAPLGHGQVLLYEEVRNDTGAMRDDLHCVVDRTVTGSFRGSPFTIQSLTPGTKGKGIDFSQGFVNPGESAFVSLVADESSSIVSGYWTLGGVRMEDINPNPVIFLVSVDLRGMAHVTAVNRSSMLVPYSGLAVDSGADITQFDINNFVLGMGTGMPVDLSVPPDGALPPGSTLIANFPNITGSYNALSGIVNGAQLAVGWTGDRIGSTTFGCPSGCAPLPSSGGLPGLVLGPFNNLFALGAALPSDPLGTTSATIWSLSSFGALNRNYGNGGIVNFNYTSTSNDFFTAGAATLDGGLLAAGNSNDSILVVLFDSSGNVNSQFPPVSYKFMATTTDTATSVVPLNNIYSLAFGRSCNGSSCQDAGIKIDASGNVVASVLDGHGRGVVAAQLGPNGHIYVLSTTVNPTGKPAFRVAQRNPDDLSLVSESGAINFGSDTTDVPRAMAFSSDGNALYLTGAYFGLGSSLLKGEVLAINPTDYTFISGFNGNGRVSYGGSSDFVTFSGTATSLLDVEPPGVTVVGSIRNSPTALSNALAIQFNTDGSIKNSAQFPFSENNASFTGVALQPFTGNIYASGFLMDMSGNTSRVAAGLNSDLTSGIRFGDLRRD